MVLANQNSTEPTVVEFDFDPDEHPWVRDHCPTYVLPALPMTFLAELLAEAALATQPGLRVTAIRGVRAFRWLICDRPRRLRTETTNVHGQGVKVRLLADSSTEKSGWELISAGSIDLRAEYPYSLSLPSDLLGGREQVSPYSTGRLFHGLGFQYMTSLQLGPDGSSCVLDPTNGSVFIGRLNPGMLDASTHGIPHDAMNLWCPEIGEGFASYPLCLHEMQFFGPSPTDKKVRCEARFHALLGKLPPRVMIHISMIDGDRLWARLALEEVCLPKGPLGSCSPAQRVAFLRDAEYVEGVALSRFCGGTTTLERKVVAESDWLPGTMATVYETDRKGDLCRQIAVKEHVARLAKIHPARVRWSDGETSVFNPSTREFLTISIEDDGKVVQVRTV